MVDVYDVDGENKSSINEEALNKKLSSFSSSAALSSSSSSPGSTNVFPSCFIADRLVLPGDVITTKSGGCMQGKGVYIDNENKHMVASVRGFVRSIDKLIYVETLKSKYVAKVGDVLVGRIDEIVYGKWLVDIGGGCRAELPMCNVNVEHLAQRRKTYEDIKSMRSIFKENDIISCDVQRISNSNDNIYNNNVVTLQIRTDLFGKLTHNGCLLKVQCSLVKGLSKHMLYITNDVHIIIGCNGYIFVSSPPVNKNDDSNNNNNNNNNNDGMFLKKRNIVYSNKTSNIAGKKKKLGEEKKEEEEEKEGKKTNKNKLKANEVYDVIDEEEENDNEDGGIRHIYVDVYKRSNIARVRNAILFLSYHYMHIAPENIYALHQITINGNISPCDILKNKFSSVILNELKKQIIFNQEKKKPPEKK